MIKFFTPLIPPTVTHNDLEPFMRKGKPSIRKSEALKDAEAKWEAHLARFAPDTPLCGPLKADLMLCWPTDGKHEQGSPKETKPDLDNTEKTVWDVCEKLGFYGTDAQIVEKHVVKMWSDPAGVYMKLEEV